jgi:hypothetical protein
MQLALDSDCDQVRAAKDHQQQMLLVDRGVRVHILVTQHRPQHTLFTVFHLITCSLSPLSLHEDRDCVSTDVTVSAEPRWVPGPE